jgi:hypothetical protein
MAEFLLQKNIDQAGRDTNGLSLPLRFSIEQRTTNINMFSKIILAVLLVHTFLLGPELVETFGGDGVSTKSRLGLQRFIWSDGKVLDKKTDNGLKGSGKVPRRRKKKQPQKKPREMATGFAHVLMQNGRDQRIKHINNGRIC